MSLEEAAQTDLAAAVLSVCAAVSVPYGMLSTPYLKWFELVTTWA